MQMWKEWDAKEGNGSSKERIPDLRETQGRLQGMPSGLEPVRWKNWTAKLETHGSTWRRRVPDMRLLQ